MMKNNYHTHTYHCGHAIGNEEAMVEAAIEMGIEKLGFSEHVPLPRYRWHLFKALIFTLPSMPAFKTCLRTFIKNGPAMRCPYPDKDKHLDIINKLKIKYNKQIKIVIGFEAEYLPEYLSYYQSLLADNQVDYLILGHHFNKYCIHTRYNGRYNISDKDILKYKDDVIKAIKTNLFSYVAHPDLFMVGKVYFDEVCREVAYEICRAAKEYNIPLEINGGGVRKGRRRVNSEMLYPYPNDYFFDIASEVGNDIIIGLDCHEPGHFNQETYDDLVRFAHKHQLNLVDNFEFRKGE